MPSGLKGFQCFSTASKIKPNILSMSTRPLSQDVPQLTSLVSSHTTLLLSLSNPTTLAFYDLPSCPPPQGLCTCFSLSAKVLFLSLLAQLIMLSPSEESLCTASLEIVFSVRFLGKSFSRGTVWLSFWAPHSVCCYALTGVKMPTELSVPWGQRPPPFYSLLPSCRK